jgi:stage V sporulation protein B
MALYGDSRQLSSTILMILGAASFFVCLQIITTAILQANGFERITMITFPVGGVVQIALDYYLVGNPQIGIVGSPIGTLACFAVISAVNIIIIYAKVKNRPKLGVVFTKPLICTAVMAALAFAAYTLLSKLASAAIGSERMVAIASLVVVVPVAVLVYAVLIVKTRTVTEEDLKYFPKGEKLARILRIKQ